MLPESHSAVEYVNNGKFVTETNELTDADDLAVNFVAVKGEYENVLYVATVTDGNGKLISLATENVTFDETEETKETKSVRLTLENLPSDITDGGYTVNVMLWDAETFKPIVSKIVMD